MSEHFQGKFEVELKYHLQHPEEFITALKKRVQHYLHLIIKKQIGIWNILTPSSRPQA